MFVPNKKLILASKSPRRQELLILMGLQFEVRLKDVEESYPAHLSPSDIAVYISEKKANAFFAAADEIIITSDTIVALEGEILGKPEDTAHATEMLSKLSGKVHQVYTGVTLKSAGKLISFYDMTNVTFRTVTAEEIAFYIENFNPFDKAGSYGVQDWWGLTVVERMNGSYTNVMGLPTEKLYKALSEF